jgi:hypothetical protein
MEGLIMVFSLGASGTMAAISAYVAQARWWFALPGLVILSAGTAWGVVLVIQDAAWLWGAVPWWLSTLALLIHASASRRDQRRERLIVFGICPECGYPDRAGSPYCPECGS